MEQRKATLLLFRSAVVLFHQPAPQNQHGIRIFLQYRLFQKLYAMRHILRKHIFDTLQQIAAQIGLRIAVAVPHCPLNPQDKTAVIAHRPDSRAIAEGDDALRT